jgi:hypothetical protein
MKLPHEVINSEMKAFENAIKGWSQLIKISFLTEEMQQRYLELLESRWASLSI